MSARALALIFVLAVTTAPLPPISWTCPMHPDIVESSKGACPICRMELVPVRLVSVWTCPVHGVIEQETPGQCRICGRDLIQATRALTFTCKGQPDINQTEPGRCANGTPMSARYTPRPHGDHNPRHGGLFFMAPDSWHHIEGTYPEAGRFRVYLYDDYTRPLSLAAARQVRGRIFTKEVFDPSSKTVRELGAAPLVMARDGAYFEARLDGLQLPAQMTAKISFAADGKESRFDFSFPAYSRDVNAPAPPLSAAPKPVTASLPKATGMPKASGVPVAALLAELNARENEVATLVTTGAFGGLYVPALRAKDVALEIQSRQKAQAGVQREAIDAHVKQLVVASYQLDNFGDLGDAEKVRDAFRTFSTAVEALNSLLEVHP
jgi:hypothetical protein